MYTLYYSTYQRPVRIVHHSSTCVSEKVSGRGIPPYPGWAWRNGFGELELILISQIIRLIF